MAFDFFILTFSKYKLLVTIRANKNIYRENRSKKVIINKYF